MAQALPGTPYLRSHDVKTYLVKCI